MEGKPRLEEQFQGSCSVVVGELRWLSKPSRLLTASELEEIKAGMSARNWLARVRMDWGKARRERS